jgi:threonine/homoserine/homoserine lactone efflux protein
MEQAILKGIALGALLVISVGPVIFSIMKQSINNGPKGGLSFVLGVSLSDVSLVLVSNIFTELFNRLLHFERVIGMGGSLLLMGMGVYFLFFKKVPVTANGVATHLHLRIRDYSRIFFAGYFMNTLNPGVIAFWFTWATAFVILPVHERIALFAACLLVVLLADLVKVFLASRLRSKLTPLVVQRINQLSGLLLLIFGLVLLVGLLFYHNGSEPRG